MFTSRLIRDDDAILQIEALAWLIRTYGPPPRPTVPSPLHKSPQISDIRLGEMDTRSVYVWADDHYAIIRDAAGMSRWDIDLAAVTGVPQDGASHAAQMQGRAVTLYDPARCEDEGYFPATILMQLAELRAGPFQPEAGLSPLMQGMLTLACAVYPGQGFSLANLVADISSHLTAAGDTKPVPYRLIENVICFATCLNLRVRRQTMEQIVATYGSIMSTGFRRKIRQACRQIDSFEQELKLLQVLAEPKAQNLTDGAAWGPRAMEA